MKENDEERIVALKECLIKKGWETAIELLDVIKEHDSNDFSIWLRDGGTVKLMNIARPYKGLAMYGERKDPLPFNNDVYALDAAHHILKTELQQPEPEPEMGMDFLDGQGMEDEKNIYEIYTKNPETGETGWDIKFVNSHKDHISSFPNFDCIISRGDLPADMSMIIDWDGENRL